ncbi:MAG TPA: oligosaccharide flippase family protein [Flavobacterium sp.]|uniref:lipopolysaccharide biosynthesis protein n=1 Tax=unclassified Flavobacterium TaxID=196869 RepID=UPI000E9AB258|nr:MULTISPECIES: oligosaccharide flippase family protein [unclassified Flavobacterium]HBI02166.1 sugar isomerase [Flavobacterium sp.]HRE78982.1 oligosaccharide flippase family protein [Flavobacterium sp.]
MGIVLNQSIKNTIITFIGFAIGATNALFMYTHFLGEDYYGLTAFLLSSANIMMPLMAFGIQNTLVKFYSEHKSEEEKSRFLNLVLVLPFVIIIPIFLILFLFYGETANLLSQKNPIIHDYVWMIPVIGLFMGYFEIFYAWVKVHLKSVFGNFVKEVLLRVFISIFLFAVYFDWITNVQFVYCLVFIYFTMMVIMGLVAFSVRKPQFHLKFPKEKREVIVYSAFIIFSSSIAVLLLDIDKFMIGQYIPINEAAYYSVAIFIALTISVPMRAMHQITHPITTDLMARKKHDELNDLYKKTAITLQVIGGFIMLGILTNIHQVYALLPEKYSGGVAVVFLISFSKFFDLMLGNNNSIIFNSKYYRTVLFLGLCLVGLTVSLNMYFIPNFGIEGAAIATLISIGLYSLAKFLFVVFKMDLFPFTKKTIVSLAIIAITFVVFYFWNFSFHPILNILLKSLLIVVFYWGLNYKLTISEDINGVMDKVLMKIKR